MNDPHVASLRYRLVTDESVSFEAPPITSETDTFALRLEDDVLTVDLKSHFATVDEARGHIEEFLSAWEVDMALQHGQREVTFDFEDAEVIDRDPSPRGGTRSATLGYGKAATAAAFGFEAKAHIKRTEYPEPPPQFQLSPDAHTLWHRYEGYKKGHERLFSMAYFCCTVIEERGGSRDGAAKKYNISKSVLGRLGEITSTRGSAETARKFTSKGPGPATRKEREWVEQAVRALIRQVGIHDAGHQPKMLTMGDLPNLK